MAKHKPRRPAPAPAHPLPWVNILPGPGTVTLTVTLTTTASTVEDGTPLILHVRQRRGTATGPEAPEMDFAW